MTPFQFGQSVKRAIDEATYSRVFGARGKEMYQRRQALQNNAQQLQQANPGQQAVSGTFSRNQLVQSAPGVAGNNSPAPIARPQTPSAAVAKPAPLAKPTLPTPTLPKPAFSHQSATSEDAADFGL